MLLQGIKRGNVKFTVVRIFQSNFMMLIYGVRLKLLEIGLNKHFLKGINADIMKQNLHIYSML